MLRFSGFARTATAIVFAGALSTTMMVSLARAADLPSSEPAPAPPPIMSTSPWGLSFGTVFTTDYNFRGISQSARKPAIQGSAELTYTVNPNFQLYANVFGSSLKLPSQASMELDGSFGIRPSFAGVSFDFGATFYGYPGELPGVKSEFWEFYGKASYKFFDRLTLGANVFYAPNWLNLGAHGTYYSGTAAIDLPAGFAVSGELGHYVLGRTRGPAGVNLPDYTYWNAGISYTYKVATLDLRYHDTNLSKGNCQTLVGQPGVTQSKWCGQAFIASLKFNYSIDNLFGGSQPVVAAKY
ncbi:MAG: TorF family putative porin [Hyphomicrobiales bacterium]|nr:TorF family putative porin [Hyphomicrobiales bacterium]